MKFAVMANLTLTTPAQQNQLAEAVLNRIVSKPSWGLTSIGRGSSLDNKPRLSVEVRFNNKPDATDLFDFVKQRMNLIPVLSGKVSRHDCSHDGVVSPCVVEEEYIK